MLGNLIGGFIAVLIGATLITPVANTIFDATSINATGGSTYDTTMIIGTSATILNLTTIFFALAVASAGIAIAAQGLKQAGVM